jgi:protein-tyrosine phosphatase
MLPGIDDGARSMEESLAMARMAVADGVRGMLCTPHWHPMIWPNERTQVREAVAALRNRLQSEGIPLQVWAGSELSLDSELDAGLDGGKLGTLNGGPWVLLELPGAVPPPGIDDYLWNFHQRGYRVVMAHPERYDYIQRDPARLHAWVGMGVAVQITASSLLGRLGPETAGLCRLLIEHHLVHFIASDSHGTRARRPLLAQAVRAAAEVVGDERAKRFVDANPRAVLKGEPLDLRDSTPVVPVPKKRSWFSFLRRRG